MQKYTAPDRLKLPAAAKVIGVHVMTLRRWVRDGLYAVPFTMVGGHPHFSREMLRRWMSLNSFNDPDRSDEPVQHKARKPNKGERRAHA